MFIHSFYPNQKGLFCQKINLGDSMKIIFTAALLTYGCSAFAQNSNETWTCNSPNGQTSIVIKISSSDATTTYNGIPLTGKATDENVISLSGEDVGRDIYKYELKLLKNGFDYKQYPAKALLIFDEYKDCLGYRVGFEDLICKVE